MRNNWTAFFINGLIIAIIQIVFINNIVFWGNFNPKIYPLFLLLFPRILKPSYFMTLGFLYGLVIDMFSQTYGIGMASAVFLCFSRPYIFRVLSNRKDEDELEVINKFKDSNYLIRYVLIGLFVFHLVYFFIEMGELYNPFYIIWKTVLSTLLAAIFFGLYKIVFVSGGDKKMKKYSFK